LYSFVIASAATLSHIVCGQESRVVAPPVISVLWEKDPAKIPGYRVATDQKDLAIAVVVDIAETLHLGRARGSATSAQDSVTAHT
jgi:hypothetical protein